MSNIPMQELPQSGSLTARFLTEHRPRHFERLQRDDDDEPQDIEDIYPTRQAFSDSAQIPSLTAVQPPWKRTLLLTLEYPTSSPAAFLLHISITALIVFSAVITILETIPALHNTSGRLWFGIETSLVALFTVEYVARCVAWSYSWTSFGKWVGSFVGIIDLLAILPYYIEIALQADTSAFFRFSILRTFRLLRVFRPFRHNSTLLLTIEVMYLSFQRSQHALLALSFFVVTALVVFSTLLYFAERGTWDETLEVFVNTDGDPSQFASIPAAAWFVLVTISTVGYGEITPRSILGRLITLPLLIFGLLLIALPSFVLGREFSLIWAEMSVGKNLTVDIPHQDLEDVSPHTPLPQDDFETTPLHQSASQPNGHLAAASTSSTALPRTSTSQSHSRRASPSRPGHSSARDSKDRDREMDSERDLTNRKLAENQTELARQIAAVKAAVERQEEVLRRLVTMLEERER